MKIRSFIAIKLSAKIVDEIRKLESLLLNLELPVRLVPAENIHLTLRFLGSLQLEEIDRSEELLAGIVKHFRSFGLRIEGWIFLPSGQASRVIGLAIRSSQNLEKLESMITSHFNREKLGQTEKRSFMPHLTLARVQNPSANWSSLDRLNFSESLTVKSLELMKSELNPDGAKYSLIKSFPFQKT
jgi:2'-5' RNA ligase